MDGPDISIVILGGGTAGWMAANMIAKRWRRRASVTVIESSDIGTVGVGEGSTPQLRGFFKTLGISEQEWMPRCNATYKNGIRFRDWSERRGFRGYFHPFVCDLDSVTMPPFYNNTVKRRRGWAVPVHPDRFSLLSHLAAAKRAPVPSGAFPHQLQYGFHFDAGLLGQFLRTRAMELGVRHLDRKVLDVGVDESGKVTHLDLEGGETLAGDLFFDASGFRSVIAQEKLGVRFIPFRNLFNDSAVVAQTDADQETTDSHTASTALSNGWLWKIPLTNRYGNGYVYSSRYISDEDAEREFREQAGVPDEASVRLLRMKVGKIESAWTSNCVAIGLAQSFIEPLEATALMIVQRTVDQFMRLYEKGGFTASNRALFNKTIDELCETVRDYIVCHYKVNGRTDTDYWRDNRENREISDTLRFILRAWFKGRDLQELKEDRRVKGWGLLPWHALLAGYGCFPVDEQMRAAPPAAHDLSQVNNVIAAAMRQFPDQAQALRQLAA